MWTGERWRLFLPDPGPDATLWTGPEPGLAELGEIIGVSTSPLADLPSVLDQAATATLPAPDIETCVEQSTLLRREIRPAKLAAIDEDLADAVIALRLIHDDAAIAGLRRPLWPPRPPIAPGCAPPAPVCVRARCKPPSRPSWSRAT